MVDAGPEQSGPRPRPRRTTKARGGLGQGLGALIPDREPIQPRQEKPLDVLFPDLTGASGESAVPRGGSARDLLSPRSAAPVVSRETVWSSPKSTRSNSGPIQTNVSRETVRDVANESPDGQNDLSQIPIEDHLAGQGQVDQDQQVVSRETLVESDDRLLPIPGVTFGHANPTWIIPNLKQPRHVFDDGELEELAASISEVGILQPIVVRRITAESLGEAGQAERLREALANQPEARYELVMGERRWRAAQIAGLGSIPIIVRATAEDDLLREALIENIHRVQLNALEEAAAYSQLMDDFGYTQEQLAARVSKSRPQITNTLRLLKLPSSVQRMLAAGVISAGHARAILGLSSTSEMQSLADRIVSEGLSVRAAEELVKFGRKSSPRRSSRSQGAPSEAAQRVADAASVRLDTPVKVVPGAKKSRLVIEFADQEDLDRIALELGF